MRPYNNNYYPDHRYPEYLVVLYRVSVKPYDPIKETDYYVDSLHQTGEKFAHVPDPSRLPIYLIVLIANVAEHTSGADFAQSHKAAKIFRLQQVLDGQNELRVLVASTPAEPPPFVEDDTQAYLTSGTGGLVRDRHMEHRRDRRDEPVVLPSKRNQPPTTKQSPSPAND